MQQSECEPRKNPDPDCPWCLGQGVVDSGGMTPWDAAIFVACGCTYGEVGDPINPRVNAAADELGRRMLRRLRRMLPGRWGALTRVRTDRAKSESSLSTRTRARMPVL